MFKAVQQAIASGKLDAELAVVFCNRDHGESTTTDAFFDLVTQASVQLVTRSSVGYRKAVGGIRSKPDEPLPAWRLEYDRLVDSDLEPYSFDIGMLAGYMLILEQEFVRKHAILNLHPALPTGPAGMWKSVIRELIRTGAKESGIMLHLAIPEVDEGPPVAYCRYPLRDIALEKLRAKLAALPEMLDDNSLDESELFAAIRERGLERESPLVVATLAEFAAGKLRVKGQEVLDGRACIAIPSDLTKQVDSQLLLEQKG